MKNAALIEKLGQRPVRSFVRRQGRLSEKQHYALDHLWGRYGLSLEQRQLDLAAIFGRAAACIVEIGFGMGQSFIAQAQQNPQKNYLGIEVHKPGIANVLRAIEAQQLANVRLFNADAVEALQQCIPDNALTGVQLFFPDPWHKRRHHKRRLVQPAFAALIQQKLMPQGKFYLATDWREYAVHMLAVLSANAGFVNAIAPQRYAPRAEERLLTKFERRGQRLGHEVFDLVFVKKL